MNKPHMLFPTDPLFYQRLLKAEGHYHGALDAIFGPLSRAAAVKHYRRYLAIRRKYGSFSKRTESNLVTLTSATQIEARLFLYLHALKSPLRVEIVSGSRTYAEQFELYAQGRYGDTRPIITNARGGMSRHNFGIAFDIALFSRFGKYGRYLRHVKHYAKSGELARDLNLEWSGDWPRASNGFYETAHFQLAGNRDIVALRQKFERGQTAFV